jgi:hypothetical protein
MAPSEATITLNRKEVTLIFGALVEATEALSASEFQARVGIAEVEADELALSFKALIVELDGAEEVGL